VALQFGIFDHLDESGEPLAQLYETRLKLVEQYDRLGFRSYHIAEHHSSTLGMAPSPSVFLAAVAQRTSRLRFGPLVFVTPMYHPLRLIEEIVMLDHLSKGRLEMGLGRGASPIEIGSFGVDFDSSPDRNRETTEIVLKGLTSDVLSHAGKFYNFDKVRIAARPLQKPYPPFWTALIDPERAKTMAARGAHIVTLVPNPMVKPITDAFRAEWKVLGNPDATLPMMGLTRHVVVAETDAKAQEIARAGYPAWRKSMAFLWEWAGMEFPIAFIYPSSFEELQKMGMGIAGTPETVRRWIANLVEETGINYLVCDPVFGSIPYDAASRSIELLGKEVMPAFR
jgi:alkanesulfonate monooxygenase SsuD/methylene tetrahydromethanopterin reductase-like flavin-dependent oxidoreductase (luciferase family)